ncbi:MAG: PEP-utilizing protein [Actinobacteria bacterium RBG_16_68_21]|nr:MAG: PEP-utilizing protein [Actinobacteria bacterium RBG_16_68_21]
MADTSKVVAEFFGSKEFPVKWDSETEKKLFWVYDDLHCPQPLSPMYFDIGGWWMSCDHMFRRFGTPFAVDWTAKNVNGYLYTAAIPQDPDFSVPAMEYGSTYTPRINLDPEYPAKIGAYLGAVLPTYGLNFATWWRERLVPEMRRNLDYLESKVFKWEEIPLMEWAVILEDAIDVHDRHWKIHWMLNFAQLSATLNLRAVVEEVRGTVDDALLGRLQNSAADRNWDAIETLWKIKEKAKKSKTLGAAFASGTGMEIHAALDKTAEGKKLLEDVGAYQREFGWHAVWSHEFIFPSRFEEAGPVLDLIKGYIESDYDYPTAVKALADDIAAASKELLAGLEGEALEKMKAANEINLKMAPLTPDHHFYIDQGTNQHVRVVLICIGKKLVQEGVLDAPDDVIFLKYNELRYLLGDLKNYDARSIVKKRRQERLESYKLRPADFIGTATESQLAFPYLNLWGFPEKLNRAEAGKGEVVGLAASPGTVEGVARVVMSIDQFDEVNPGDIMVCQMTNPAWTPLFAVISGIVTDAGGVVSHPAVMAREFGIPAVIGTSIATLRIKTGDRIRVDGTKGLVQILS